MSRIGIGRSGGMRRINGINVLDQLEDVPGGSDGNIGQRKLRHLQAGIRVADELSRIMVHLVLEVTELHAQKATVKLDRALEIPNRETEMPKSLDHDAEPRRSLGILLGLNLRRLVI